MLVKIKLFGAFRELLNKETVVLNLEGGSTVKDAVCELACQSDQKMILDRIFNRKEDVRSEIVILVKGRNIENFRGFETKVEENDVIYIFLLASGGQTSYLNPVI
ncbi:MoaD/ThiS family protein [Candidatus Bathyarchaeota archaeon]|nr:MoaD/ThiS family protein [Candidatus Bathyarchaeota archaeon]